MRKYTDIFIDFDDTLYDTRGSAEKSLTDLYEQEHLDKYFDQADDFYTYYWKWNVSLWAQYAKGEITRDKLIVERFRQPLLTGHCKEVSDEICLELNQKFLDLCSQNPRLLDGARDILDYFKEKGYRLHMCSNGFGEVQFKKLKNTNLESYFDTIVLSEEAGVNKPSALFFDFAFKKSGAIKENTVMIGDNYDTDIMGAINADIDAILFNRWDKTFVPKGPVNHIVNSLKELKDIL